MATQPTTIPHLIQSIVTQLSTIGKNIDNNKANLTQAETLMMAMETLLGPTMLDKALQLCARRGAIQEMHAQPSGRICCCVVGSSGTRYRVIPGSFCSCADFGFRSSSETPWCKHLLAVEFARIEGFIEINKCEDEKWGEWVLSCNR